MTAYSQLIAGLRRGTAGRVEARIPEDWMQGRTTYGGLTAALCLESAMECVSDMPVRAAQVAFIGPVGGDVVISPTVLRRGKSSAFVNADLVTEDGLMARCLFTFGAKRASKLDQRSRQCPDVKAPDQCPAFFSDQRPTFAHHFDIRLAGGHTPMSGADRGDMTIWLCHKDEGALWNPTTLLSIADAPPPAAMSMMTEPAPISSMTWMAEFLTDDVVTEEGWFLAHHEAQATKDGYSSQSMRLWNRMGEPVMIGRQTVAVFG
ncbi:thioesterase family protein [Henriciella aquimarina]|uniref:thioesterase family protein n=1 Tax=Henriciella aquimarina TaxID=545261 RepID=UPI0009FC36F3|nr:thioesterase family protein [Henriciella aquimarina]